MNKYNSISIALFSMSLIAWFLGAGETIIFFIMSLIVFAVGDFLEVIKKNK